MTRPPGVLRELAISFGRLGLTGFGGPLALIAIMQRDFVEKRRWIPPEEFTQAFALIKAMPGPIAFQTAVYLGGRRGGFLGASIAAVMLNLPAFIAMILLAAFQEKYESVPSIHMALVGMQAAALGLILASTKGLFWSYRKRVRFWGLFALGTGLVVLAPSWEPIAIVAGGLLSVAIAKRTSLPKISAIPFLTMDRFPLYGVEGSTAIALAGSWWDAFGHLVWNSFKAGAFVFGSGIAIVPLMENDFVRELKWLTHEEFMSALAFGQITPGPVVITATFIGFKALGLAGALAATVAIFAAPFFHMTTWFPPAMSRLAKKTWIAEFLLGALAIVTAAVFVSVVRLASGGEFEILHYTLLVGACAGVLLSKTPAWALIPLAGLLAVAASYAGLT